MEATRQPNTPLTTAEAAAYVNQAPGTLENWRLQGRGPAFFRPGDSRTVRYWQADLDAWLAGGEARP